MSQVPFGNTRYIYRYQSAQLIYYTGLFKIVYYTGFH